MRSAGPCTGGQFCAHVPLQLDLVGVSGANEYSVKPLALVSTVTPPIVAVFRLPAVPAAGLPVPVLPPLPVEDVPDELHAASTAAAAATANSASSIRRRLGPLVIRCALSPLPRRGVMTSCPLCRVCQCLPGQMGWVEMIAWPGRPAAPFSGAGCNQPSGTFQQVNAPAS